MTPSQRGVLYSICAHVTWGAMAPFMGLIRYINPWEIGVHRGLWSIPIAGFIGWRMGLLGELLRILKNSRVMAMLVLTSAIVFFNWVGYIWCIQNGRALEASLGYFIQPLMNVAAGYLILHERFSRQQLLAIVIACVGVLVLTVTSGVFPIMGLFLASFFCLYGLLRKMIPVSAVTGFFIEVVVMAVPLLALNAWLATRGLLHFGDGTFNTLMLIGCGAFTTCALIFYALGIKALRFSTAGLIQYITPSLIFLTAVFIFHEHMDIWKLISFGIIWVALAVYSLATLQEEPIKV